MKTVLAALAALSFASAACAATGDNPLAKDSTVLRLNGIDLATADGQQRLAIRTDQAAREVCGDHLATIHLALEEQARACRAEVAANIRRQIETRTAARANGATVKLAANR